MRLINLIDPDELTSGFFLVI